MRGFADIDNPTGNRRATGIVRVPDSTDEEDEKNYANGTMQRCTGTSSHHFSSSSNASPRREIALHSGSMSHNSNTVDKHQTRDSNEGYSSYTCRDSNGGRNPTPLIADRKKRRLDVTPGTSEMTNSKSRRSMKRDTKAYDDVSYYRKRNLAADPTQDVSEYNNGSIDHCHRGRGTHPDAGSSEYSQLGRRGPDEVGVCASFGLNERRDTPLHSGGASSKDKSGERTGPDQYQRKTRRDEFESLRYSESRSRNNDYRREESFSSRRYRRMESSPDREGHQQQDVSRSDDYCYYNEGKVEDEYRHQSQRCQHNSSTHSNPPKRTRQGGTRGFHYVENNSHEYHYASNRQNNRRRRSSSPEESSYKNRHLNAGSSDYRQRDNSTSLRRSSQIKHSHSPDVRTEHHSSRGRAPYRDGGRDGGTESSRHHRRALDRRGSSSSTSPKPTKCDPKDVVRSLFKSEDEDVEETVVPSVNQIQEGPRTLITESEQQSHVQPVVEDNTHPNSIVIVEPVPMDSEQLVPEAPAAEDSIWEQLLKPDEGDENEAALELTSSDDDKGNVGATNLNDDEDEDASDDIALHEGVSEDLSAAQISGMDEVPAAASRSEDTSQQSSASSIGVVDLALLKQKIAEEKRKLREFVISMREKNERNRMGMESPPTVTDQQPQPPTISGLEAPSSSATETLRASDARAVAPSGIGEPPPSSTLSSGIQEQLTEEPISSAAEPERQDHFTEEVEEEEDDDGGDEGDDLDMFAVDTDKIASKKPAKKKKVRKSNIIPPHMISDLVGPADTFTDSEGYFKPTMNEILHRKYKLVGSGLCGKGVFSCVVKATDLRASNHREVAIKILRANDLMRRAGEKEVEVLKRLNASDVERKRHIIHLDDMFVHRDHLCLVFEFMSGNLRTVIKKNRLDFGGLHLKLLWKLTRQIFIALKFLKKNETVHADIKPDNMLLSADLGTLMLCDLGSACDPRECETTPYLVSRFYRAPEIILGAKYSYPVDVWSTGCTLYEMATGEILFTGRKNNHMLKKMMDVKGRFPNRLLKTAKFRAKHFTNSLNEFIHEEEFFGPDGSVVSTSTKLKPVPQKAVHTILDLLTERMPCMQGHSAKLAPIRAKVKTLADLIDKCLAIDPAKRITPEEAFHHPFIKEPFLPPPTTTPIDNNPINNPNNSTN